MLTLRILFCVTLISPLAFAQTANPKTEQELTAIAQELMDAIAPGKKEVWEKYLADSWIIREENGQVLTKAELLKDFNPLPPGYVGKIKVTDVHVRDYGNVAVISHRDKEELELYGQMLKTEFGSTDTYMKIDGQWKVIASHISVYPSELTAVTLPPEQLQRFTGAYELKSDVVYTITLEDNKLIGQRTGRAKEELFPENETRLFRKGAPRGIKIFVPDEKGRFTKMIDRRDNVDLVWRRIK
ncbi:DUF4440 domain-containing protein [bacterium]|nr:DUF4440 domain-containing protein [bacterium]